jgi:hypothetical protein
MTRHRLLIEAAEDAADKLHSDTSVSLQQTLDSLEELREHVDELVTCVKVSLESEE